MSTSLFYYEPAYNFDRLFDIFSPLSNNANAAQTHRILQNEDSAVRPFKPRMDLHEDSQNNKVTATFELPGVKKEDVNINLQNGRLTISAETKLSDDFEKNGYAVRERRFGRVARTLQLPQGIKDEEVTASMENGLLTVTFPKTVAELTPKKITIA